MEILDKVKSLFPNLDPADLTNAEIHVLAVLENHYGDDREVDISDKPFDEITDRVYEEHEIGGVTIYFEFDFH